MLNEFSNMEVLVTGGTRGIGLATARAFAARGARCTLTYSWGGVHEADIEQAFAGCAQPPRMVRADVTDGEATESVLEMISREARRIDVFVSNVAQSVTVNSLEEYDLRTLNKSIQYSAWPLVDYLRRMRGRFSAPPRYVLSYSSAGPDHYFSGYDVVAACKAVLETWSRYLSYRLLDEDCRINVIRTEWVETESAHGVLGAGGFEFARKYFPETILPPEAVANAAVALCSGLMDAVRGQVISIDRGSRFFQNVMYMHDQGRIVT